MKISQTMHANINIISSWYVTKFSRDMYLPSLPAIALALSTPETYVKYSLTVYFFGLALSRFIWTPLSDMFGRRMIFLLSLPLFLVGSILAMTCEHIDGFIVGRLLQALGIGCATSLERAMVYDVYGEKDTIKALAWLSLFGVWAPAFATIIGGHLTQVFGWRSNFLFLALSGGLLFLQTLYFLKETTTQFLPKINIVQQIFTTYYLLLKDKEFCRYMLCFSFTFSGTVVYYTIAPFLFVKNMQIPAHVFGYFSIITVLGLLAGKMLAAKLIDHFSNDKVILIGIFITLVAGFIMFLPALFIARDVYLIMISVLIYFAGNGILSSTSKVGSMASLPGTAGAAAALFGMAQGLVSSASSIPAANVHAKTAAPMGMILIVLSVLALISFFVLKPNKKEIGQG